MVPATRRSVYNILYQINVLQSRKKKTEACPSAKLMSIEPEIACLKAAVRAFKGFGDTRIRSRLQSPSD